jgi:hypothetical protein
MTQAYAVAYGRESGYDVLSDGNATTNFITIQLFWRDT